VALSTPDFAARIDAARSGDRAAREDLLQRYLPQIRAYVRLRSGPLLRRRESQSDLVQTVCRQLLEDLGDYRGAAEASFKSWLFTMALRKLADRGRFHGAERRDPAREEALAPDGPEEGDLLKSYASFCTPSQVAIAREEVVRVEAAFDELPDEYREVITLACVVGLDHRDIAAQLGRSEDAVRKLLWRARARLATRLVDRNQDS
jgi:RNA polymerase sigma-70 factor (ECF subfamily)